ncbi:MAG: ATP-grasp domain-containing protein [Parvimonas sp.]|uniref:ATP-binding protein n=1 Tax=Parvimonas sp. TaxID=1944660 RepID=UPI0025ED5D23|nr:ATP-grasp domain-containing protein [Parvimonas sp.]MCI5997142.1 ATP-grasp domain-containing protein [Parvimonas sp.]
MSYSNLKDKKLLILGATRYQGEIVREAKKLGIKTYVADYYENSPAKKLADKSFLISVTETEQLEKLCKEEEIDGIFTGYSDMLTVQLQKICEKTNNYFCGNKENINTCIDKELFKKACIKSKVPIVPWLCVNKENYLEKIKEIETPVVVKPADYGGSKGVYKCFKKEDLKSYIEEAFTYSKVGKVLIEKLMEVDKEFSVYYMIYDGVAYLSAMGDRYVKVTDPNIAPSGLGMLYPSIYLDEWIENMDGHIRKFISDNDMKDGFVFFQGFYDNGKFYIHETGYRLNGGYTYGIIEHFSGYNQMHQLIKYSLTGEMDAELLEKSNPHFDGFGMIVTISLKNGKISHIGGIDEIEKNSGLLKFNLLHEVGDEINVRGTTEQVLAYVLCAAENKEKLDEVINLMREKLIVLDENGNNMIMEIVNPINLKVKEKING